MESGIDGAVGDIGRRLANLVAVPTPDFAIMQVGDVDEIPLGHEKASCWISLEANGNSAKSLLLQLVCSVVGGRGLEPPTYAL